MSRSLATIDDLEVNLARVGERMKKLVRQRAAISAGASILPIPGIDVALDLTSLADMMNRINSEFGLSPTQIEQLHQREREAAYHEINSFGGVFVGRNITGGLLIMLLKTAANRWIQSRALRFVPIIGQGVAGTISYLTFVKLGDAHVDECIEVRRRIETRLHEQIDRMKK